MTNESDPNASPTSTKDIAAGKARAEEYLSTVIDVPDLPEMGPDGQPVNGGKVKTTKATIEEVHIASHLRGEAHKAKKEKGETIVEPGSSWYKKPEKK